MSTAPVSHANRDKTSCLRGHAYTPENTYYRPDGRRSCYTCRREQSRKDEQRKRHASEGGTAMASTPLKVTHPDGLLLIWAGVYRTALEDYRRNDNPRHYESAKAFLQRAGLLLPDGSVDTFGMHPRPPRTRRKA